jgi:hypothetical protein
VSVRGDVDPARALPPRSLVVSGPTVIQAGADWPISIEDGRVAPVAVEVWDAWGVRRIEFEAHDNVVVVPGELTENAGRLTARLTIGDARGRVDVDVLPGLASDGVVPLAGPRSMIADAEHWTMVTAIPVDRYGNVVADGTPVRLHIRRPDGSIDLVEGSVADLLAGIRVWSTTTAGRSSVRVAVDGSTGPEVDVSEVPGSPVSVELDAPQRELRADGRTLTTIVTSELFDRHGNRLLDGTAASLKVTGPDGAATLRSVTIGGRAEFTFEAPTRPGSIELRAEVDGVAGAPLVVDVLADVDDLPVSVERVDRDGRSLVDVVVGPVSTRLGGFVPDSTQVVADIGGDLEVSEIRSGSATLLLDVPAGHTFEVAVLGVTREVIAP